MDDGVICTAPSAVYLSPPLCSPSCRHFRPDRKIFDLQIWRFSCRSKQGRSGSCPSGTWETIKATFAGESIKMWVPHGEVRGEMGLPLRASCEVMCWRRARSHACETVHLQRQSPPLFEVSSCVFCSLVCEQCLTLVSSDCALPASSCSDQQQLSSSVTPPAHTSSLPWAFSFQTMLSVSLGVLTGRSWFCTAALLENPHTATPEPSSAQRRDNERLLRLPVVSLTD